WLPLAEKGEDEAEIFLHRKGRNADLLLEARGLGRLLGAASIAVERPAMIHAADAIALDPAGRELRPAMGAAWTDQERLAGASAIERQALAHDLDRPRPASGKIAREANGLPEAAEITAGKGSRPRPHQVHVG